VTREEMVQCLRDTPMDKLMNTHPNFYEWKHLEQNQEPLTGWSPRVDKESPMPFMPQEPIDFMTSGNFQHIPFITGITDDEGATRASAFFNDMSGVTTTWPESESLRRISRSMVHSCLDSMTDRARRQRSWPGR